MSQEFIVVQTPGLKPWLQLHFARENKISAGVTFLSPIRFVNLLYNTVLQTEDAASPFSEDNLVWSILSIIEENPTETTFEKLRVYIDNDVKKAFALFSEIAHLFDQYVTYREEMVKGWEENSSSFDNNDDEAWQAVLWKKLIEKYKNWHPIKKLETLLPALKNQTNLPFKRVSFFGFSTLRPTHMKILEELSLSIEVNIFFLDSGVIKKDNNNELFESWGMMGKEFADTLMVDKDIKTEEVPSNTTPHTSLLSTIQSDIRGDSSRREEKKEDGSISMVSAHSELREVEILHDYILSCFEEGGVKDLKPDEILVVTPNIDNYTPYIHALFSQKEPRAIPFSIADATQTKEASKSIPFLDLLSVLTSRFEVTPILSLLAFSSLQRKFGLVEQDIETIKQLVDDVE